MTIFDQKDFKILIYLLFIWHGT